MQDTINEIKSFWSRTEGKVGIAFIVAALGLGALGIITYHNEILAILQDTVKALILLAVIGTSLAIATSKEFGSLMSAIFKVTMYNLTNAIVSIDPIAVAKGEIEKAKTIREHIEDLIQDFRSQVEGLREAIRQNDGKIQMSTKYMVEAKKQLTGLTPEQMNTPEGRAKRKALIRNARTASRKEKSNKTYGDLLALAERTLDRLMRAKDSADLLIEDKEEDIAEREKRYKMSKSVISIVKKVKQLKGTLTDSALYDMSIEHENATFARSVAALENFTETNADFISKSDLANGIYEDEAMKRLESIETGVLDNIVLRDGTPATSQKSEGRVKASGYDGLFG